MKYSELALKKMLESGVSSKEEQIKFNILNFIKTLHLNELNFIETSFESEFFDELPMTFKKKQGQLTGFITVFIKGEVRQYVFNDKG